jgi:hypothetical protein
MGRKRCLYRALVRKPEGKRPLGRLNHKWEDNIEMDLQGVGWGYGMDLSGSEQVADCCQNGNEQQRPFKCRYFLAT